MRYPKLTTDYGDFIGHPDLLVTWAEGEPERRYCGSTGCRGSCGLPALVVPATKGIPEHKVRSAVVAVGRAVGYWPVKWTGLKEAVPEEHRAAVMELWWL